MLVGREVELGQARRMLDAGGAIALVGPAGVGKTTLARAVLAASGPWREAGALATLSWSPLFVFRRLLQAEPSEDPESVAYEVVEDIGLPILLDDVQWADDASLDVVAALVGRCPMILTVRTGEATSERVREALELVGVQIAPLAPLELEDAERLADRLHPELDLDQRADLVARAAGSPLLLEQLPLGADATPRLVTALLDRRAAMSEPARTAMDRLAVLGRPVPADLLGPGAAQLVDAAIAVATADGYEIVHSLLAEVVVDEMGARADELRRQLADEVGDAEAAHLLAAAGDRPAARARALRAAEGARRRERADLLALAVRCSDDLDLENRVRACRLLTSLSEPAAARDLAEVADLEALAPIERGALRAVRAEAAWLEGDQAAALALTNQAIEDLRGSGTAYEVAVLAGSTVSATFLAIDGRPALERAREAVRLADAIGAEQGYARSRLASVLLTSGLPGWKELLTEVIAEAERTGEDDTRRTAVLSLVLGCWITGDPLQGAAVARAELAKGPRQRFDVTWLTLAAYAAMLGLIGGSASAELVTEFGPFLEAWPSFRSRPFMAAAHCLALADRGDHAEALRRSRDAIEEAGAEAQWRSIAWWARIEVLWLTGRSAEVAEGLAALERLGMGDYPAAIQARIVASHAARDDGRPPVGDRPASTMAAWEPASIEHDALVAAWSGDPVTAVRGFEAAADAWAPSDVRSELRCRWAAGDVAAQAGLGTALLLDAERRADALGQTTMGGRIRRSLRAAGVARRQAPAAEASGLTHREAQALDAVGQGMRSTDIAAALGLSTSTVDSIIRSAVRKLGAATRVEAAAKLAEIRRAGGAPPTP